MAAAIHQARVVHDDLAALTERLIAEYDGEVVPGSVIRVVARTVHDLRAAGVPTEKLAAKVEPVARSQLRARSAVR